MGMYAWVAGHRAFSFQIPQIIYSAVKMPILIFAAAIIAFPAFFIFNNLAGLRDDIRLASGAIVSSLATFSIAISSLAPITLMFYISLPDSQIAYRAAVLFNAIMFTVATIASSFSLFRSYLELVKRNPNHWWMMWVWYTLFSFVGIQMGWTLRPFIGSPFQTITFFREDSFTNAYFQVARIVFSVFT